MFSSFSHDFADNTLRLVYTVKGLAAFRRKFPVESTEDQNVAAIHAMIRQQLRDYIERVKLDMGLKVEMVKMKAQYGTKLVRPWLS